MAEASLVTQMRTERFAGPWEQERALPGTQNSAQSFFASLDRLQDRKGSPVGASLLPSPQHPPKFLACNPSLPSI